MLLNKDEQAMLDGALGPGTAYAMKIQLTVGEAFGAARMVPVTRAHVALCNQEADIWFARTMLEGGAHCRIAPTVNPGICLSCFSGGKYPVNETAIGMMRESERIYRALGAELSYSCTPYLSTNIPRFGEICAFSEGSATPYFNAVWGARTNRESSSSALCAAITGVVPEYGLLLEENRKGDILVRVEAELKTPYEYHLLGMLGDKIGDGIPVFTGIPADVSPESLRNLGSQLNVSGSYPMYHIPGVTPEAPTLSEAFGGRSPKREVVITEEDLKTIEARCSDPGGRDIDYVILGCPHYTVKEVRELAEAFAGKKVRIPVFVLVSFDTMELVRRMGLKAALEASGVELIPDTCTDQGCWSFLAGKEGITDSPKCAYYTRERGMNFVVRRPELCIQAALSGRVE